MPTLGDRSSRSVERVARLCRSEGQERHRRAAILDEIRSVVGFDAYAWLLTDPETSVGCAPLADVPCLPELPRLVRLKYLTAVNRWTSLPGGTATLQEATGGHPERSLVWRELMARYDVSDVASLVFRDGFGCWGFLDLWRSAPAPPFTAAETAFLTALTVPVTEGLRAAQARTFHTSATSATEPSGPAVLVMTSELDIREQTEEVDAHLRALLPTEAGHRPVAAGAYNVAAQLLAVESGIDDHPASARVALDGGTWVTLRAARIGGAGSTDEGSIAVTVERTPPTERRALFCRAHALSPREAELVDHVARGDDTRRIAARMFLSAHTVQDHLKSIFAKTSAPNRRVLVAWLTGR